MFRALVIAVSLAAAAAPAHHRSRAIHHQQRCDAIGIMYVRCLWKLK